VAFAIFVLTKETNDMIQLIEIMLKRAGNTPKVNPAKLQVNPEDVSHLHRDDNGVSIIIFKNNRSYTLFDDIDTVKNKLQLK